MHEDNFKKILSKGEARAAVSAKRREKQKHSRSGEETPKQKKPAAEAKPRAGRHTPPPPLLPLQNPVAVSTGYCVAASPSTSPASPASTMPTKEPTPTIRGIFPHGHDIEVGTGFLYHIPINVLPMVHCPHHHHHRGDVANSVGHEAFSGEMQVMQGGDGDIDSVDKAYLERVVGFAQKVFGRVSRLRRELIEAPTSELEAMREQRDASLASSSWTLGALWTWLADMLAGLRRLVSELLGTQEGPSLV
ncbi:hypothetical protein LY78DRAFT_684919 [Colletotrichum sublineola]|nr:hypothetical protein LY78DRAFT_684919 [Colletotrichum sublineola]